MGIAREDRKSGQSSDGDFRSAFQIDRDRLLYSMPFRRLAGVTQVVSPGEGEIFHNRLTHSLKVAQIARRFAENLPRRFRNEIETWGRLDPDVVEAAALAHDLGHPPFGHVAEKLLDKLIAEQMLKEHPVPEFDGYEGNAQSFRIVTELAVRGSKKTHGLDLARATLNATLKYPWKYKENENKPDKYGSYQCDDSNFEFARATDSNGQPMRPFERSLEAQIMDWSDDIAYSIHDTEDFYRAGLVPLDRLAGRTPEREKFLKVAMDSTARQNIHVETSDFIDIFGDLFDTITIQSPYEGTRDQQTRLANFVSSFIKKFVENTSILPCSGEAMEAINIPMEIRVQVAILKQLVWTYVIENPAMAAHQLGQKRAINTLFAEFNAAVHEKNWALFPAFFREQARDLHVKYSENGILPAKLRVRLIADTISSMTDKQALLVYQQFTGVSPTSMLDPVVS